MSVRTSTTGPSPFFSSPTTPSLPTFVVTSGAGLLQLVGDPLRRFDLLMRQFGMGVQMRVQRNQLGKLCGDPGIGGACFCDSVRDRLQSWPAANAIADDAAMTTEAYRRDVAIADHDALLRIIRPSSRSA